MKRILLTILAILLTVILFLCMKNGVNIGNSLHILGFQGLANKNQELTTKIAEANTKKEEYTTQLEKIQNDTKKLTKAKKEYLDLVAVSTDSEIQNALQTKTYRIEFLWSQVGNHATKNGVVVKMDVVASSVGDSAFKNLSFDVTGNYLAITNFISDLENDSDLQFTIDNFSMTSKNAKFIVKDVRILKETTTSTSTSKTKTTNTTNNTTTNTTSTASESTKKITNTVSDAFAPITPDTTN